MSEVVRPRWNDIFNNVLSSFFLFYVIEPILMMVFGWMGRDFWLSSSHGYSNCKIRAPQILCLKLWPSSLIILRSFSMIWPGLCEQSLFLLFFNSFSSALWFFRCYLNEKLIVPIFLDLYLSLLNGSADRRFRKGWYSCSLVEKAASNRS